MLTVSCIKKKVYIYTEGVCFVTKSVGIRRFLFDDITDPLRVASFAIMFRVNVRFFYFHLLLKYLVV